MRTLRGRKRRGAALVLVLIFAVGALMLVTTMLSMASSSVSSEGERQRLKGLHGVLKLGIAAAVNEINTFRILGPNYVDPEGNGPGALTGTGNQGVEVRATDGRLLGRYRALIDRTTYAPRFVLTVVATTSTFTEPAPGVPRPMMIAAEVQISKNIWSPPPEATAFDVPGVVDAATSDINVDANSDISIVAPDLDTPASNMGDPVFRQMFIDDVLPGIDEVYGSSSTTPGDPATGAGTISNQTAGFNSERTMLAVRAGAEQLLATNLTGATAISGAGTYAGDGFYKMDGVTLSANKAIKGEGTLFITGGFTANKDAVFEWKGTIIVVEDSKLSLAKDAFVRIGGDTGETETGEPRPPQATDAASNPVEPSIVVVLGVDQEAQLDVKKDANVQINGSFLMIAGSGSTDDAEIKIKKDLDLTINGIFSIYAPDTIRLSIDKDAELNVNGSFALVTSSASAGEIDVTIKNNQPGASIVSLSFDADPYLTARQALLDYFPDTFDDFMEPARLLSYWEKAGTIERDRQDVIMLLPVADWGMDQ